jgi:hypothetical protein
MKKLLPLGLLLLFFSCVSKKQYAAKEQEVSILKKQLDSLYNNGLLDTDKDGIVDKSDNCPNIYGSMSAHGCLDIDNDGIEDYLDKCPDQSGPRENFGCPWLDTDGDGITDNIDRCPSVSGTRSNEGCPEVTESIATPAYSEYFQRLKPTATVYLSSFFKRNTSLLNCNNKIIKVLNSKLLLDEGEYKYFYLENGSFGIITNKQCITKDGKLIKNGKNTNDRGCKWFDFTCVEEGYSQFYILFITKKGKEGETVFSETEFLKYYNNDALDTNWRSIPELNILLKDSKNVFSEDYSFIVKLFRIQKIGMAKAELVRNNNYNYKTPIKLLFNN